MQGVYPKGNSKYSLPRPYYLKPKKDNGKVARNFFTTPKRKLIGYVVLFFVFALVIYNITPSQAENDTILELETAPARINLDGTVAAVGGSSKDRPIDDEAVDSGAAKPSKVKGRKGEDSALNVDEDDAPAAKEFLKAQQKLDKEDAKKAT
ncbi:unnamed protein product [Kuraishia capsulata CBS 1993]|uniref:Uncharacterized protein n=1 Tax=Kuraishia capsulata CBS 1993 TaxID=1382522 RepID=W6MFK8_9ASCO|nr:uncharacterized protein KUCA_T00000580001 [Kuraishia capsulata CBS 1993]CDK24614.1 unnamed protein product [Kuraishia capsulata CBS 1993]